MVPLKTVQLAVYFLSNVGPKVPTLTMNYSEYFPTLGVCVCAPFIYRLGHGGRGQCLVYFTRTDIVRHAVVYPVRHKINETADRRRFFLKDMYLSKFNLFPTEYYFQKEIYFHKEIFPFG